MNKIKEHLPILSIILIFTILGGLTGGLIFATDNTPTLIIGSKSTKVDPIFTEDLGEWHPGYYTAKTLKVKNNLNLDTLIKNISMKVDISKDNSNIGLESSIGREYLNNMELKIEVKDKKIFKKGHNEILFDGNFEGFLLGIEPNIKVEKKGDLDLVYTLGMNKNASANIEGIDGSIDFIFQVQQDLNPESGYEPPKSRESEPSLIWLKDKEISKGGDTKGHWAHDCIITLLEKGIIKGYPDGSIRPENKITRAEAATLVGRSIGIKRPNTVKSLYKDKLPNWANDYILELTNLSILEGYDNGEFRPNNFITREEMIKLLVLAFQKEIVEIPELEFLDKDGVGNWAIKYVEIGVGHNIIEGYPDGSLRPKASITRGETFTILCKLLGLHEEHINK